MLNDTQLNIICTLKIFNLKKKEKKRKNELEFGNYAG